MLRNRIFKIQNVNYLNKNILQIKEDFTQKSVIMITVVSNSRLELTKIVLIGSQMRLYNVHISSGLKLL